jgi:acetolactate synthase-1/2/3 large subunit
VAIVGDGAFMMHGAEVSSAAQAGVGAIWVVLYNNDLAMVSQGMADLYPPANPWVDYYKLGAPDLVKFAQGLGANAVAIQPHQDLAAFQEAMQMAIQLGQDTNQPQVIVAHIDTVPMPPYGWPQAPMANCIPK